MRILAILSLSALLPGILAAQLSQTLPSGYDNGQGGSGSAYPFSSTSDHIWQWHYDSAQFQTLGPITITEAYVRVLSNGQANAFNFPSLELVMASSPTDYSPGGAAGVPGHDPVFANNLNPDATVVRTATPWTGSPPAATWIPFGLTSSFFYDPTAGNDFVLQLRKCGTVATWGQSIFGTPCCPLGQGGNRYGDLSSCTATTQSFSNNEFVPILKIDYVAGAVNQGEYQINQPGASFLVNGVAGSANTPAMVIIPINAPAFVTLSSTATGMPWDLVTGAAPLIPRSAGALTAVDGQVVNLDLTDPTLAFLWHMWQSPGFANQQHFASFAQAQAFSAQAAVVDPSQISNISLSQPLQVMVQ